MYILVVTEMSSVASVASSTFCSFTTVPLFCLSAVKIYENHDGPVYVSNFFYVYLPFSSITFLYGMTLMYKVTAIKIELQFTYPYKNIKMMVKVPIIDIEQCLSYELR